MLGFTNLKYARLKFAIAEESIQYQTITKYQGE